MQKARVWKSRVTVWCPACREVEISRGYQRDGDVAGEHTVPFEGPGAWSFNGDLESPTLAPSLLLTYDYGEGDQKQRYVCHSFVRAGVIQYLGDCTHALAGQSVPLVDVPQVDIHGAGV